MDSAPARAATNGATAVRAGSVTLAQAGAAPATRTTAKAATALSKAARQRARAAKAVSAARRKVGAPYRWGGTGPGAFDCSGLAQYSWRKAGVRLPRISHSQYRAVRKKVSWRGLRPGDLLFFYGKGHVGIYVGKGRMVHAPSSGRTVRVVKLKGYYRSAFAGAVRPGG
ncbi:C40 family peptidase [Planomonospora sp. ID82291]|uniref:C40 family peptidase n=1 Tax=Planomonospora sp. ID82291 TaxID=2738136 RepID=UPI0018C43699|nr:C40 family peptidase [Planomonospora sp. ID82291]MBG0816280.1 C40 family peptidase [Planomonospora sp. ID82291]